MRESFKYGSVRGAAGNSRPYRDSLFWRLAWRKTLAFPSKKDSRPSAHALCCAAILML